MNVYLDNLLIEQMICRLREEIAPTSDLGLFLLSMAKAIEGRSGITEEDIIVDPHITKEGDFGVKCSYSDAFKAAVAQQCLSSGLVGKAS